MADDDVTVRVRIKERLKFARDARKTARDIERIGEAGEKGNQKLAGFNVQMTAMRNIFSLLKPAALITGIGLFAQGVSAASAGLVGLLAGLGPTVGLMASLPGVMGAIYSGAIVTSFGLSGVSDALGGLHEEIDESKFEQLTNDGQKLVLMLDRLKPRFVDIQESAQRGLFPGLISSVKQLKDILPGLDRAAYVTGRQVGFLAAESTEMLMSFRGQGPVLLETNRRLIRDLGWTAINLASAFTDVVIAAQPMTRWLGRVARAWSGDLAKNARAGRKSGGMAEFFTKTRKAATLLMQILGPFTRALGNIFGAGFGTGTKLLTMLRDSAREFERWTASAEGQNAIKQWFEDALPAMVEAGRLISALVKGFFDLGTGDQVAPLLKMLREDLGPAIMHLIDVTTKELGPEMITMFENLVLLISDLSDANGPLKLIVKTLGKLFGVIHDLAEEHPKFFEFVITLWALQKLGKIFVLTPMLKAIAKLKGAWVLAAGAVRFYRWQVAAASVETGRAGIFALLAKWGRGLLAFGGAVVAFFTGTVAGIAILAASAAALIGYLAWKFEDWINKVPAWIQRFLESLPMVGPVFAAVFDIAKLSDEFGGDFGAMIDSMKQDLNSFVEWIKGLPGWVSTAVTGLWDGLKNGFEDAWNWIIGKWNEYAESFTMTIPGTDKEISILPTIGSDYTEDYSGGAAWGSTGLNDPYYTGPSLGVMPVDPNVRSMDWGGPSTDFHGALAAAADRPIVIDNRLEIDGREVGRSVGRAVSDRNARR